MKIQRLLAIAMFFVLALPVGAYSEPLQCTVSPFEKLKTDTYINTISIRVLVLGQTSGSLKNGVGIGHQIAMVWLPETQSYLQTGPTIVFSESSPGYYIITVSESHKFTPGSYYLISFYAKDDSVSPPDMGFFTVKIETASPD